MSLLVLNQSTDTIETIQESEIFRGQLFKNSLKYISIFSLKSLFSFNFKLVLLESAAADGNRILRRNLWQQRLLSLSKNVHSIALIVCVHNRSTEMYTLREKNETVNGRPPSYYSIIVAVNRRSYADEDAGIISHTRERTYTDSSTKSISFRYNVPPTPIR